MTMILKEIQIHCDGVNNVRLVGVIRGTVMAKKRKTTLLVILLTKSFYVIWPPLYVRFLDLIHVKQDRNGGLLIV